MSRRPVAAGLTLGWTADRLLGDPRRGHPVAGFGRVMGTVESHVWRDHRTAGIVYTAAGVVIGAGPVLIVDRALRRRPVARTVLTATVTWAALGGRSLAGAGRNLARQVAGDDLDAARALAPTLVGRDPATLDGAGLSRAGLESVAENTSDAVVAPLVWGVVLGAPGVALHRALNTMDAMVGYRSPRYERFGWASARADDVAGWPAARLAAALTVVLARTVPTRRPHGSDRSDGPGGSDRPDRRDSPARPGGSAAAWRAWRRDGGRHPSPNAGQVEAAFAGALGVRLGGRNVYAGRTEDRPVLGDGPHARDPDADDLARAATLSLRVGAAAAVVTATVAALVGRRRRTSPATRRPDTAWLRRCGH